MFLHNWVDIFSAFVKIWVETDYDSLTIFGAAMTWFIWIYSRLIVFPQLIYYGILIYPYQKLFENYDQPNHIDK